MRILWQDLRYGARMMLKRPGFTLITVLTLALGIGANTAIFSLIDAVLLKSLPVKQPDRLVFLERTGAPQGGKRSSNISYFHFEELRNRQDVLSGICTFTNGSGLGASVDGQAEVAEGQLVSGDYYAVLGVGAVVGRTFTADDDKVPGEHPVAVISYRYWQRRFDLNPAVVGKTIILNSTPFTIIGVTPPEFFGATVGRAPDIWVADCDASTGLTRKAGPKLWQLSTALRPGPLETKCDRRTSDRCTHRSLAAIKQR